MQTRGGPTGAFASEADSEEELMALVRRTDISDLNAALWMVLLLRLTSVSNDKRSEVRNGNAAREMTPMNPTNILADELLQDLSKLFSASLIPTDTVSTHDPGAHA